MLYFLNFSSITNMSKIIYILIIIVVIMKDIINPNVEIPDDQVAMAFFRSVRWVNGVYCPKCKSYNVNNRGNQGRTRRYVCKDCGANFNDFSGTIFHKSKIPLNVMLYILFNLDKKTTTQLSEELDYSRQCISRISKLFRDKLLSNPEFFDIDEWSFFLFYLIFILFSILSFLLSYFLSYLSFYPIFYHIFYPIFILFLIRIC